MIESTSTFPAALVDVKGRVYFDVSKLDHESQRLVVCSARRRDRFMHEDGKLYYAARLLRRHVPQEAHERFDMVVEFRKQQARDWLREIRRKGGLFSRQWRRVIRAEKGSLPQ